MAEDGKQQQKDVRYDWIQERVCSSLKVREDAFQKLLQGDAKAAFVNFLEDGDTKRLLVYLDGKDLGATTKPPQKLKRKTVYFIKTSPAKLDNDSIKKLVAHGELTEAPLETLSAVAHNVFLPLLTTSSNQEGWPDVVAKEVSENLHKFVAQVNVSIGEAKGQTVLPLPATDMQQQDQAAKDKAKIHILENTVVTWTKQIKHCLKADPDAALKGPGVYPGPLTELDFWTERAGNLNSIHDQLTNEKVQKVVKVLELAQSTYHPAFERVFQDVEAARQEANDNVTFLKPLRRYFEKLSVMDDFVALSELFKPLLHTMLLIWKYSRSYNSSARFATLIREICNDLIMQACKFVPGRELLQMDPNEACDKLRTTLKVLGSFKAHYFAYKTASATECPTNPWRFQNSIIFGRLDTFLERCNDMLELQSTCLQFGRLERVEIGGTKGKALTGAIKQVHADFGAAHDKFQQVLYDVMDTDAPGFQADFTVFRDVIRELEHRLGALIMQAFDDCTTLNSTFKLLESFEGLLERDAIAAELAKKHRDMVATFGAEVKEVHELFLSHKAWPVLSKNSPPHSGAVSWVRGLMERLQEPMGKLQSLDKSVQEMPAFKNVQHSYDTVMAEMQQYEAVLVQDWCAQVASTSDAKLNQPLLQFHEDSTGDLPLLAVNFDPALVRLLRETRYFLLLKIEVPSSAADIFQHADKFRQQIGSLDLMVGLWNKLQKTTLPVERPLVSAKLDAAEAALHRGLEELVWRSDGIDAYIRDTLELVKDLDGTLTTIKENVVHAVDILKGFERNLMFDRKDGKVYTFEELCESSASLIFQRHSEMRDAGKEIGKLLSSSNRVLKVSKASPSWKAYVDYVSDIVIEGFASAIIASARYLLQQLDAEVFAKPEAGPLLEVDLELVIPDMVWKPELSGSTKGTLQGMVQKWLMSFLEVGGLMKRLDTGEGSYAKELEEDYDVGEQLDKVLSITLATIKNCEEFKGQFMKYDYLWKQDLNQTLQLRVFKDFLEAEGTKAADGSREDPPLAKFEQQIQKYKAVGQQVASLPGNAVVSFIKISAKPLRTGLTTWASKWVYLFTHYLQDKVVNSISELYSFMDSADATLARKVLGEGGEEQHEGQPATEEATDEAVAADNKKAQEEQYRRALYDMLSCMRDVRKRSDRTDAMFDPLKETSALLHAFGIQLGDNVLKQLENAEFKWKGLKKKMLNRREQLAALQQAEAVEIRRKSDAFAERVEDYRKFFLRRAPFSVPNGELKHEVVRPAYQILDAFHHGSVDSYPSVTTIVAESKQLQELQELFELYVSDYLMLQRCNEELLYLKSLWDMVGAVMYTFADWCKTPWDKIDVDVLIEESKKLSKDVKTLNKAVRNYEVYRLLEESLKAMITSLPLVQDLHHPAMRDRHWKMLMQTTGKHFTMDEKFCLGDLLALGLHNYVDACRYKVGNSGLVEAMHVFIISHYPVLHAYNGSHWQGTCEYSPSTECPFASSALQRMQACDGPCKT
eukprot:GHRR01005708.1.p1 GENE.GHRR01005708.1~~GHRR01005708.1.p1  ORF type:complete len:1495 (+),score=578.36 GHRR01005708.1:300-4784(+)